MQKIIILININILKATWSNINDLLFFTTFTNIILVIRFLTVKKINNVQIWKAHWVGVNNIHICKLHWVIDVYKICLHVFSLFLLWCLVKINQVFCCVTCTRSMSSHTTPITYIFISLGRLVMWVWASPFFMLPTLWFFLKLEKFSLWLPRYE